PFSARANGPRPWPQPCGRNRMVVFGIHPVLEALRAGRVSVIRIAEKEGGRHREVLELAARMGVAVRRESAEHLASRARGRVHQGVVAELTDSTEYDVAGLVRGAAAAPFLVVLGGVEDPHDLGGVARA